MYIEKVSSRKSELKELLKQLQKEIYLLKEKDVDFVSVHDLFDISTPTGKAMFGMLAVFAEFERDNIQQLTKAGLEAVLKRGVGGRPAIEDKVKKHVKGLFESGESALDIAKEYGIGRAVYKIIRE